MKKRDAKRDACHIVGLLIEGYFDVGQPHAECRQGATPRDNHERIHDEHCADCDRLHAALTELRDEMRRRS